MNNVTQLPTVKIASREFKANPFPFYARLRAEQPVYKTTYVTKRPVWLVARYNDVNALLKDERLVKNQRSVLSAREVARYDMPTPRSLRAIERNMLDLDPPDHTRLRALVHKAFTPRLVENIRGRVQTLADHLIDTMQRKVQVDLIASYALPIPLTIISEILGIPTHDQHRFHQWTNRVVSIQSPAQGLFAIPAILSFARYLRRLFEERRADPRDDLITALVQAEEAGDRLSADELLAMVFILIIAGHETTVNLIGSGTLALLENPDQRERLRQDPSLITSAVEELARYYPPVEMSTERYAREDMTIAGTTIRKGDMVMGIIGSAHRDETQFERPDQLDITRNPNRHLAFGQGIHYCAGAPLARLETQIAIQTLMERSPNLRLTVSAEQLRWRPAFVLRGLEALPVAL
jgi:cytochrome P450 PksS